MKIVMNEMDADLFLKLYKSVGWEAPCREQVEIALKNTMASFVAMDGEIPRGMLRLLGDGGMSLYIKDFAVVPESQGRGVGKMLLQAAEKYIKETIGNWAVSLELISTIKAQKFYEKMGFETRPCEWDGPGMFKMLR